MSSPVLIVKTTGEREAFDRRKLFDSLRRAGANVAEAEEVTRHIEGELTHGMSTTRIYKHAFDLMHRKAKPVAARYSLRRAVIELGPAGFAFEKFISAIFAARGYHTQTNVVVMGACAEHEMDVVAWDDRELLMIEAKFHNELGIKSDLKVALYMKARFDDIRGRTFTFGRPRQLTGSWLITNTKFTDRAIRYSECAGVRIVGWNYPRKGNLHDLIGDSGLHPLTSLASLSGSERSRLLERGYVLCRDVLRKEPLESVGITGQKAAEIMEEARGLCGAEDGV
jgi:hypothetical protein